ncbi:MAG: hypothetical protein GX230_08895 [Lentisphaerae bacterium]|nr:hypothetical protein [Lentisphaerota bacterium]
MTNFNTWCKSAALDDKADSAFVMLSAFEHSASELEQALPGLLQSTNDITANLSAATRNSRTQIAETLENIRTASETLNTILDKIKERPSMLIRDTSTN